LWTRCRAKATKPPSSPTRDRSTDGHRRGRCRTRWD
jgi:hypothetical protein